MHAHHRFRNFFVLLFGAVLIGVVVLMGRLPGSPPATPATSGDGCHATIVAQDGTPPAGTPTVDPQRLCDALDQAEQEASCMGDWQPPPTMTAREECLEVQHRGCGSSGLDCARIPADTTYYYHH